MDRYLATRNEGIASARRIIGHIDGEPIEDASAFNADGASIYSWQRYYQINNTYQELVNSGNFALLSNDTIKNETSLTNADGRNRYGNEPLRKTKVRTERTCDYRLPRA